MGDRQPCVKIFVRNSKLTGYSATSDVLVMVSDDGKKAKSKKKDGHQHIPLPGQMTFPFMTI